MLNADGDEIARFLEERLPPHLEKLLATETVELLQKVGPPKPPGKQAEKKGKKQEKKVMDEARGIDHVYHFGVWKGQSEIHFHPTSESHCTHTRAYIKNITPVLDFLAGAYERACPTRHTRCVDAAIFHGLPRSMPGPSRFGDILQSFLHAHSHRYVPSAHACGVLCDASTGYPHPLKVVNVGRTGKPHNDIKDDKDHMSIDTPFGDWEEEGDLEFVDEETRLELRSGDIGLGNFRLGKHFVTKIKGKGVRCSLLMICPADYFRYLNPPKRGKVYRYKYQPRRYNDKNCTGDVLDVDGIVVTRGKFCHMCSKARLPLRDVNVEKRLAAMFQKMQL